MDNDNHPSYWGQWRIVDLQFCVSLIPSLQVPIVNNIAPNHSHSLCKMLKNTPHLKQFILQFQHMFPGRQPNSYITRESNLQPTGIHLML